MSKFPKLVYLPPNHFTVSGFFSWTNDLILFNDGDMQLSSMNE